MEQIYFSERLKIEYGEASVKINDCEVPQEQRGEASPETYAKQKMRQAYQDVISKQYENIVILSGAGTSVGVGREGKKGMTMKGLWQTVVHQIGLQKLEEFAKSVKFAPIDAAYTDLEDLLSHAMLAEVYYHRAKIKKMIDSIESIIRENCNLDLPENAPHIAFIGKVTARKLKYSRAKIFTLNYDLLFEKAASKGGYVVIDGFSFNTPRVFNGTNFDYDIVTRNTNKAISEESFFPKVFHLYKIHGSLDWERINDGECDFFIKADNPAIPVMIYPSNSKYEASYEQPYFEMISRFQQELRSKNILLIVIGFSFYDKHIKAMIDEALNVNPSITMVVVCPNVKDTTKYSDLKSKTQFMKNIILISESFEDFSKYFPYSDIYDYSNGVMANNESV